MRGLLAAENRANVIAFRDRLDYFALAAGFLYFAVFLAAPDIINVDPRHHDAMTIGGFALVLFGVTVALPLQQSLLAEVRHLEDRGDLILPERHGERFAQRIFLIEQIAAIVLFVAIFVASIVFFVIVPAESRSFHLVAGALLSSWLVAGRFAAGITSGAMIFAINRGRVILRLTPGHRDHAAGFGRLGKLFFSQAFVVLLPALFMFFWWYVTRSLLISLPSGDFTSMFGLSATDLGRYIDCLNCAPCGIEHPNCTQPSFTYDGFYQVLLPINFCVMFAAVLFPVWVLHRKMGRAKQEQIEPALIALRDEVRAAKQAIGVRPVDIVGIKDLTEKYDDLAGCPVWPIPFSLFLTAIISNASAVVGILEIMSWK